jgi:hypothetical protein
MILGSVIGGLSMMALGYGEAIMKVIFGENSATVCSYSKLGSVPTDVTFQ